MSRVERAVDKILEQVQQAYVGDFRNIKKVCNSSFTAILNTFSQLDSVLVSFDDRDIAQKLHDRLVRLEDEAEDLIRDIRHEASKEIYDNVYLKKNRGNPEPEEDE